MSFQRLFIVQLLQKCFDSSPLVKFGLIRVLYKVMPQAHVRTTLIQGLDHHFLWDQQKSAEQPAKARGLWDFCQHHSKKDASFSSILLYFIGTVNILHDSQERSSEIATWSIHFHPSITDATRHGISCLFLFTEFVKRFIVLFCHLCARRNSNNFHHLINEWLAMDLFDTPCFLGNANRNDARPLNWNNVSWRTPSIIQLIES